MTSSAPRAECLRVGVFARAPVAGAVKTRLVPELGAEGAAHLHARLVRHALQTAVSSGVGPVELWCAPDERDPFFRDCAEEYGITLRRQCGGDLGARMLHAFRAALSENAALVLIGSDCPALSPEALREAASALAENEAVLAPAEDGGYVLVGLARPIPAMFEAVPWGGASVMSETRARLEGAGVRWKQLATFWDIDRPGDYARLRREGLLEAWGC